MRIAIITLHLSTACMLMSSAPVYAAGGLPNKRACLHYEPKTVQLAGKLERRTYPGAPNFEDVASGDEPETGFYLRLAAPICVVAGEDEEGSSHDRITDVQLVLSAEQYQRLRPRLGSVVSLSGSLFEAFTGHHHTTVLLSVDQDAPTQ